MSSGGSGSAGYVSAYAFSPRLDSPWLPVKAGIWPLVCWLGVLAGADPAIGPHADRDGPLPECDGSTGVFRRPNGGATVVESNESSGPYPDPDCVALVRSRFTPPDAERQLPWRGRRRSTVGLIDVRWSPAPQWTTKRATR